MPISTPYFDNTPTPAPPTNVGFKISKPGYDANRSSGANMLFDSSWPSLPIALEVTVNNTITSSTSPNIVIPHNLGFPPFAMAWCYGPDPNGAGLGNVGYRFIAMTDKTNVYINGTFTSGNPFYNPVGASKIRVLVFAVDLSRDIDYALAPGASFNMPYDNSYGVKLVKTNKDIHSTDMRDYAIHSRCQSPLVWAVKTQDTMSSNAANNGNTIQFTNKTSTPVWVYGFIKGGTVGTFSLASNHNVPAGTYIPAPYYAQSYPVTTTDGFVAHITYTATGTTADLGATLLILRDPMFAANPVTVQY